MCFHWRKNSKFMKLLAASVGKSPREKMVFSWHTGSLPKTSPRARDNKFPKSPFKDFFPNLLGKLQKKSPEWKQKISRSRKTFFATNEKQRNKLSTKFDFRHKFPQDFSFSSSEDLGTSRPRARLRITSFISRARRNWLKTRRCRRRRRRRQWRWN